MIEPQTGNTILNPWPGLASYTADQRSSFFGREAETIELASMIERERLTMLFGRSGLGKTSLLRAGVIPALQEKGYLAIFFRLDYSNPAVNPIDQVKALLLSEVRNEDVDVEGVDKLAADATLWEFFHAAAFWGPRNDKMTPLLVFDQFEEIFTIGQQNNQADFLRQLADLAENRVPVSLAQRLDESGQRLMLDREAHYKLVFSLREDYVSKLDLLRPILPAILRNRFALAPFDGAGARRVILKAGSQWISESVADQIADFVSGTSGIHDEIEPAYLSVMCHELFRRMQSLGLEAINSDLVEQEKGGILESLYERSLEGMPPEIPLFIENRLLTKSGFRAAVLVAEAEQENVLLDVLRTLVDRRLLRFEDRLGARHVELSHDLLTGVVLKSRDERLRREKLETEARHTLLLRQQLMRARRRTLAATTAALFVAGIGVFIWLAFFHVYTLYSKGITKQFGVARPVNRISREAVHHRWCSMRLQQKGFWRGGQILAFDAIGSNEKIKDDCGLKTYLNSDDEAHEEPQFGHTEYVYDNDGLLVYETGWNRFHQMIWGLMYAPASNPADARKVRLATFVGRDGLPQPQRNSHAEILEFHYDGHGNEIKVLYKDREGNLTPGPYNAYGHEEQYDGEGREISDLSLDIDGHPMNDTAGNASSRSTYNQSGDLVLSEAFDATGHRTAVSNGRAYSIVRQQFDRWGNYIEQTFFDASNSPVISGLNGCHRSVVVHDEHGNQTEFRCYGVRGEPIASKGGNSHIVRWSLDAENRPISLSYFDVQGNPAADSNGVHKYTNTYDALGFLNSTRCRGTHGEPVSMDGYHRVERLNDDHGNPLQFAYFGPKGDPVAESDGVTHIWRKAYDGRDRVIQIDNLGFHGEPILGSPGKVYRIQKTYDRFNNETSNRYFNTQLQPVLGERGCHIEASTYNEFGQRTGYQCLGIKQEAVNAKSGVSREERHFDKSGLLSDTFFYDKAGHPVPDKNGDAHVRYSYNSKRQVVSIEHYNAANGPRTGVGVVFREVNEYDPSGRRLKQRFFDASSHEISATAGDDTQWIKVYDDKGHVIEESYKDNKGLLHNDKDGEAIIKIKYDAQGRNIDESHWDESGKPVWQQNGYPPVFKRRYNDKGIATQYVFEDGYGHLAVHKKFIAAEVDLTFDAAGHQTSMSALGSNHRPIVANSGAAKWVKVFDNAGNEIRTTYYDERGIVIYAVGAKAVPLSTATMAYLKAKKWSEAIFIAEILGDDNGKVTLAHKIHLHVGDVILDYDGATYNPEDASTFLPFIKKFDEGDITIRTLGILRDGKRIEFKVPKGKLGTRVMDIDLKSIAAGNSAP